MTDQSITAQANQPINRPKTQLTDHAFNISIKQRINQMIDSLTNQINFSIYRPTEPNDRCYPSIDQKLNDQLVTVQGNQRIILYVNQPANQSTNQSVSSPTNQSIDQPTIQPTSQSITPSLKAIKGQPWPAPPPPPLICRCASCSITVDRLALPRVGSCYLMPR